MGKKITTKQRKANHWDDLQETVQKYSKALFVNVDNVTSKQICIMRKAFREMGAKMICGKNVSCISFN